MSSHHSAEEETDLVSSLRDYVSSVEETLVRHEVADELLEPWTYIRSVPGKNVRGVLISCFNKWLNISPAVLEDITSIVSDLHTASLIIDDIEDGSKLRRGVPVAHAIYGVPFCINTANYVYFLAMEQCNQLQNPEATKVFLEEMLNLHRGQGWDILWRERTTCPTEAQYRQMVLDKTGGLFRLAIRLMAAFSECEKDFIPLVECLAQYFQIRDDYINVASAAFMANKSFCEDLTEGKFSFLAIYAIQNNPGDHRLINILKQRTEDVDKKLYALAYMREAGAFEYTRKVLRDLRDQALKLIEGLGGHKQLVGLIMKLDAQIDAAGSKDAAATAAAAPAAPSAAERAAAIAAAPSSPRRPPLPGAGAGRAPAAAADRERTTSVGRAASDSRRGGFALNLSAGAGEAPAGSVSPSLTPIELIRSRSNELGWRGQRFDSL